MGNEITFGAIVKTVACVHFLNTKLTKSGVEFIEFKRRVGDVERVLVTYNFESRWEISTLSMN